MNEHFIWCHSLSFERIFATLAMPAMVARCACGTLVAYVRVVVFQHVVQGKLGVEVEGFHLQ